MSNDYSVALIFFNRPELFRQVFDVVRIAKPSNLFLIQDGPRDPNDLNSINECREIIKIDWDCNVSVDYSDINLGCGNRIISGLSNAFKQVDRLIILEDDCVPSIDFFSFASEMLEKYKDDYRINMISGMNHLGHYKNEESSYFFSQSGSIWGWATWDRSWNKLDLSVDFVKDERLKKKFVNSIHPNVLAKALWREGIEKRRLFENNIKQSSWSYQYGIQMYLNNQINIIPSVNLISNCGAYEKNTNGISNVKYLPKKLRQIFNLKLYKLPDTIIHPKFIISDYEYQMAVQKIMRPKGIVKFKRLLEYCIRYFIYGKLKL